MSAEHKVVAYIESVLFVSRGVFFRSVEGGEVMEVVLDFLSLQNLEAHARKYVYKFVFVLFCLVAKYNSEEFSLRFFRRLGGLCGRRFYFVYRFAPVYDYRRAVVFQL